MGLSIRNKETERLAREVAHLSGQNLTQAIQEALAEKLVRLKRVRKPASLVDDILTISERCAALPDLDTRSADEILGYDGDGGLVPWS